MSNDVWYFMSRALNMISTNAEENKKTEPQPPVTQKSEPDPDVFTLTEEDLRQMKWMNDDQLYAIFGGGKKHKAQIVGGTKAYNQLKWFNADQLHAIFGKDETEE